MKSWNEIRKAATAFSKRWKNTYDEKAQALSMQEPFAPLLRDSPSARGIPTVITRFAATMGSSDSC